MNYVPVNLTAFEIVKRAGFINASHGFQLELEPLGKKMKRRRYHAIIQDGLIRLHVDLDFNKRRAHPVSYKSPRVQQMIKNFKEIDII